MIFSSIRFALLQRLATLVISIATVVILASPTQAALVNYWDFSGNKLDTAASFAGNNSLNATDWSAGGLFPALAAGQAGPSPRTAAGQIIFNTNDGAFVTANANTADNELKTGFTWASWVYIHRIDSGGLNYVFTDMPGNAPPGLAVQNWGGAAGPTSANNIYLNSSTGSAASLASLVTFQTWAFLTITSDGTTWSVYKNGVVDANFNAKPTTRTAPPAGTHQFQIGNTARTQYRGDTFFANMSTWDNYLDPSQVLALYNNDGVPISLTEEVVPEPGALALMALGAVGLILRMCRPSGFRARKKMS